MFKALKDLAEAIKAGRYTPSSLSAYVDHNELYVYDSNGVKLFSDVVTPDDIAELLGIEDVNPV